MTKEKNVTLNVAKAGRLQSQGAKGEAVVSYRNALIPPMAGQDLKPSGFPALFMQLLGVILALGFKGVRSAMSSEPADKGSIHATKRCPECYAYVSLRTRHCPACKSKLGDVDIHGMAKRTVNWTAYLSAFVAVLSLGIYIWWAFLR